MFPKLSAQVVMLCVLTFPTSSELVFSQQVTTSSSNQANKSTIHSADGLEPKMVIDALANKNPQPEYVNNRPVFDSNFDWNEHGRVWDLLTTLARNAEVLFPQLVEHMDDTRYCTTVKFNVGGGSQNWTVGRACRILLTRTLSAAYYQHLTPQSVAIYAQMRSPDIASSELVEWCEKRSGKQLFQLQIEVCELAIAKLERPECNLGGSKKVRAKWIEAIQAEAESMAKFKRAALPKWFSGEEYIYYGQADVGQRVPQGNIKGVE